MSNRNSYNLFKNKHLNFGMELATSILTSIDRPTTMIVFAAPDPLILEISVVQRGNEFFETLIQVVEERKSSFNKIDFRLKHHKSLTKHSFAQKKSNCLFFIDAQALLELNDEVVNPNEKEYDFVLIRDKNFPVAQLPGLKSSIEKNGLILVGHLAMGKFSANVVQFLIIDSIVQKLEQHTETGFRQYVQD